MLKRILAIAAMVCALPALANAAKGTLTVTPLSYGGKIVATGPFFDSNTNTYGTSTFTTNSTYGAVQKSYSGATAPSAVITPNTGYKIAAYNYDGTAGAASTTAVSLAAVTTSLDATFVYQGVSSTLSVTSQISGVQQWTTPLGNVNMLSVPNVYAGTKLYFPLTFKFMPKANCRVNTVTITGDSTGVIISPSIPGPTGQAVSVTFPVGYQFNANVTVNGTFAYDTSKPATAKVTAAQTVAPGATPVTLDASPSLGAITSYNWVALTSNPEVVTLSSTTAQKPTFTAPATPGTYKFKVTVSPGNSSATAVVIVSTSFVLTAQGQCVNCHAANGVGGGFNAGGVFANWTTTGNVHKTAATCGACHPDAASSSHPGVPQCATCHAGVVAAAAPVCASCHSATGTIHNVSTGTVETSGSCIVCHSVALPAHPGNVADNNGVRAITGEFAKWSHHVTGVVLQDAHCAACHLEGKVVAGVIVVDTTKHMADAQTHLRNADTNADMPWDPATPNHTTMDNFCMSCHDSNGATGIAAIQAAMIPANGKTASATNPFGDTISNQYDQLERPAVVDAAGQFATSNPSHHAVLGKRYTGRARVSAGGTIVDATFAANSSANLPGKRSTIFSAGKFNAQYKPLGDTLVVADDSLLHCGDCHTVGQWKPGSATNMNGTATTVAIGAHGSNNEYMLRNTIGTDEKHTGVVTTSTSIGANDLTKPYLVCFNCHKFQTYGSTYGASSGGHANEYAKEDRCNGPYNTINTAFGNMAGAERIQSVITINTSNGTLQGETFGNMLGIQCANCHNSGVSANNIFGGIHGSKTQTYTDGMGNTTKHERFLPGLGNSMFVPGVRGGFTGGTLATYTNYSGNYDGTLGGTANAPTVGQTYSTLPVRNVLSGTITRGSYEYTTGGVSSDLNWEQRVQQAVAGITDQPSKAMGCYTLSPPGTVKVAQDGRLAATDDQQAGLNGPNGTKELFDNWGGCDDHNGAQGAGTGITRKVLRPVTY